MILCTHNELGNVVASQYDQSNVKENACSLENVIQAKCECGKCKMKSEKVLSNIHVSPDQSYCGVKFPNADVQEPLC